MTDRTARPPGQLADVVRLAFRAPPAAADGGRAGADALDPQRIRNVLAMHLAGQPVPRAVFEYALQEICRLIDEAQIASSSDSR